MGYAETSITHRIIVALEARGAVVYKNLGSAMSISGTPDLFVCWKGKFIAIEVKTETNIASPAQEHQMKRIREIGKGKAAVCRSPEDAIKLLEKK